MNVFFFAAQVFLNIFTHIQELCIDGDSLYNRSVPVIPTWITEVGSSSLK